MRQASCLDVRMPIIFLFICFFEHLAIFNYVLNCLTFPNVHLLLHFVIFFEGILYFLLVSILIDHVTSGLLSYSFHFAAFFLFYFLMVIIFKAPMHLDIFQKIRTGLQIRRRESHLDELQVHRREPHLNGNFVKPIYNNDYTKSSVMYFRQ